MANDTPSRYLHGTEPEEQQRLTRLNEIVNARCLRELDLEGVRSILDVGCGLGQLTRDMARKAGVRAVGVEIDAGQLAEAERQARLAGEAGLLDLRRGRGEALPLGEAEWGSFDLVHTRFLLEHVREPLAVVREMVRAARAGGRIVLEDDLHDVMRLWPEPPGFGPLWQAYIRSYDRLGNDPHVGQRLVSLLWEAGAAPVRNTLVFFGSCAGSPEFGAYVENTVGILHTAQEEIVGGGLLDREAFDQGIAGLRAWKERPDAAMWFAIAWAEGVRPPGEPARDCWSSTE